MHAPYAYNAINSLWPIDTIWHYITWLTLIQVMAWCLMVQSHYLKQCWLITYKVFWYSPEANFTWNAQVFYPWYELEINYFRLQSHPPGTSELNISRCCSQAMKIQSGPIKIQLNITSHYAQHSNDENRTSLILMLWKTFHSKLLNVEIFCNALRKLNIS